MMTTFFDGAYPPVMGVITTYIRDSKPLAAGKLKLFKFNNSCLFCKSSKKEESFDAGI